MDDSSITDSDGISPGPTVASILGVKGPLRFRPHGSSQKAHVVLRRVEISDDSSDDGETNHVVYFSLFAQKRIEVKPGKEILLTVASSDGRFKDRPIIFEGDLPVVEDISDEEDDTQVAEEEEVYLPPVGEAIPPKMRRAWTKRVEEVSPPMHEPVAHSSIGIQVEPMWVSTSVQTQSNCSSASVQAHPICMSTSVQVDPPSPPLRITSEAQTVDTRRYISSDIQTDDPPFEHELISTFQSQDEVFSDAEPETGSERSLSPMELDSPTSSSPTSPILSPNDVSRLVIALPSPPRRSRTSSIASSSGAQDMQMSPVDVKPSPDVLIVTPLDLPPSHPAPLHLNGTELMERPSIVSEIRETALALSPPLEPESSASIKQPISSLPSIMPLHPFPQQRPAHDIANTGVPQVNQGNIRINSVAAVMSTTPQIPLLPPKPWVNAPPHFSPSPNLYARQSLPLVAQRGALPMAGDKLTGAIDVNHPAMSQGNVGGKSDATASSRVTSPSIVSVEIPKKTIPQPIVPDMFNLDNPSKQLLLRNPPVPRAAPSRPPPRNPFVSAGFMTEFVGDLSMRSQPIPAELTDSLPKPESSPATAAVEAHTRPTQTLKPTSPAPSIAPPRLSSPKIRKDVPLPQNAVASSSKVLLDRVSPPSAPRSLTGVSSRSKGKSPILTPVPMKPQAPTSASPSLASPLFSGRLSTHGTTKSSSPPPDPKTLAYISSGPLSNPLNIRPSTNPAIHKSSAQRAPPTAPKVLAQTTTKKRVVVGSGWPLIRQSNGPASGSSASPVSFPSSNQTPKPQTGIPPPDLPTPVHLTLPAPAPASCTYSQLVKSPNVNIVSYSSPSPPSPPQPNLPSTNKWKPVANDDPADELNLFEPVYVNGHVQNAEVPTTYTPAIESKPAAIESKPQLAPLTDQIPIASTTTAHPPVQDSNPNDVTNEPEEDERSLPPARSPFPSPPRRFADDDPRAWLPVRSPFPSPPRRFADDDSRAWLPFQSPPPSPPSAVIKDPPITSTSRKQPPRPASALRKDLPITTSTSRKPAPPIHSPLTIPQPLIHPLPPKPPQPQPRSAGFYPHRGLKRDRGASPDSQDSDFVRRRRRALKWPAVDNIRSHSLNGEGDLGVREIAFNSDGSQFAISCSDRTIRIWNNHAHAEIARLSHNAPVMSVAWMDGDAGVVSLGDDGVVSKWTRTGQNHWQWAKILDAGNERRSDDDAICLAYMRDRIAVSFPRSGVKVWVWAKGTWQPQRSILRQNVTAIKFVEDGGAMLGGTRDGVLWHCEIPNGTLRAYAFLKTKISFIDINALGTYALVAQTGGCAHLIGIRQSDNKGKVEQVYTSKETEARNNPGFGALFAGKDQAVLFGSVEGCALVWDKKKGAVVYGLDHGEEDVIQAVASFDGSSNKDGYLITGTKQGKLTWWTQPISGSQTQMDDSNHKRPKLAS